MEGVNKNKLFFLLAIFLIFSIILSSSVLAEDAVNGSDKNSSFFSNTWNKIRDINLWEKENCTVGNYTIEEIVEGKTDLPKEEALKKIELARGLNCLTEEHLTTAVDSEILNETEKLDLQEKIGLYQYLKAKYTKGYEYLSFKLWRVLGGARTEEEIKVQFKQSIPFAIFFLIFLVFYYPFTSFVTTTPYGSGTPVSKSRWEWQSGNRLFDRTKRVWYGIYYDTHIWKTRFIWYPILYLILSFTPIANRIIQIITFDFLGVHPVFGALILATVISYLPYVLKVYLNYKERNKAYENKIEEQAAKEVMKAQLKR